MVTPLKMGILRMLHFSRYPHALLKISLLIPGVCGQKGNCNAVVVCADIGEEIIGHSGS